jgi:plastocyanin
VVAPLVAGLFLVACGGGGGGGDSAKGYVPPKGPATETISISAKNFSFTPDQITTQPGIKDIELTSTGGLHDLVFDGAFSGFQIEVESGQTDSEKVDLKPGKYTFYCSLPGHRQAGMVGTITVTG